MCRDILHLSSLKQHALAALPSCAFLVSGLGTPWEPPWRSTSSLNTKHGDGQVQVTAHPSLGNHRKSYPTFRSLWAACGLAIGSAVPVLPTLGPARLSHTPNARQILIDH